MAGTRFFVRVLSVVVAMCLAPARSADWLQGTATPYGASEVAGTIGGACGYGNLLDQGYGVNNAALSMALFSDGASCGQCYLIICDTSKSDMCKPETAVSVTATNLCPPSYQGGWCNLSRPHFEMSQPAWLDIGVYSARPIIPIIYQRTKCSKTGGVKFTITGFNYFQLVLLTNMAGSGSIKSMWVKGANTVWKQMTRNWGANWQCLAGLAGQALSFSITSTGGQTIVFQNVIPAGCKFGQTYSTYKQFDN
ncbi:unnamed protein product [Alopecurus aequalis]